MATRFRRVRWGGIMDSLAREEFDAFIPTGEALLYFTQWTTHQWLQIKYGAARLRFLQPDFRGKGDLVAHELHIQCDLRQVASLLARDLFPPPRGQRLALDSVSFVFDTIRA